MARVRYIGPHPVRVPELGSSMILPDEVAQVPDERYDGYLCQPGAWEAVEEPQHEALPVKKATTAKASTAKEIS